MSRSRAQRALGEPKASLSRPREPRRSLPAVAEHPITPGSPFPVHSSYRDERKRRREWSTTTAPSQAGRQEEPILVDGAEVRARHLTYCLLRGSCRIGVRFVNRVDRARQYTFGIWQRRHPFVNPVRVVWLARTPGRVQEKNGELDRLIVV